MANTVGGGNVPPGANGLWVILEDPPGEVSAEDNSGEFA